MAEVVHLASGENPPETEKWVMVVREEATRAPGVNITLHSDGATFGLSPDERDTDAAVAQAREWADAHDIPKVYVRL
jgi:hypothetical protein